MDITVEKTGQGRFRVRVKERDGISLHEVTLKDADYERLGGGATPEQLIAHSFEFLLEREPKESILAKFDLAVIGQYFPEYEAEIHRRIVAGR